MKTLIPRERMEPALGLLASGIHLTDVARRVDLPPTTIRRYALQNGVAVPPRRSLKKYGTCTVCGVQFSPVTKRGKPRVTCSLKCHIQTRDYSGTNNPNYRHGQQHVCDHCHQPFVGKRPGNGRYMRVYCSLKCSGVGTVNFMSKIGIRSGIRNRRDLNEPELIAAANKLGVVWVEAPPLDGWCWQARHGWRPVEIKQPSRKGSANEFQPSQLEFFKWCKHVGAPFLIWYTVDDVIRDLA